MNVKTICLTWGKSSCVCSFQNPHEKWCARRQLRTVWGSTSSRMYSFVLIKMSKTYMNDVQPTQSTWDLRRGGRMRERESVCFESHYTPLQFHIFFGSPLYYSIVLILCTMPQNTARNNNNNEPYVSLSFSFSFLAFCCLFAVCRSTLVYVDLNSTNLFHNFPLILFCIALFNSNQFYEMCCCAVRVCMCHLISAKH